MIKKYLLLSILIILRYTFYSQSGDSLRVKGMGEIVMSQKSSADQKSKSMVELTNMYINSKDERIDVYIEGMIIKITNFSSLYFFHQYELKLSELITRSTISGSKKARLYLILSNKQGSDINYDYHSKATYIINKNNKNYAGIKKLSCDSSSLLSNKDLQKLIVDKKVMECNNYYLSLLYSCQDNKKALDRIKKNYFLIK